MRMRRIVICGLSDSAIYPHIIIINSTIFGNQFTEHEMCSDFLYDLFLKRFPFLLELSEILSQMHLGPPIKSDFN